MMKNSRKTPEQLYEMYIITGDKEILKSAIYTDWLKTALPLKVLADKYKISLPTLSRIISKELKRDKQS